jgi:hypothetical protein
MPGIAVGYRQRDRELVGHMEGKIGHRGLAQRGVCQRGQSVLALNYATVDVGTGRLPQAA